MEPGVDLIRWDREVDGCSARIDRGVGGRGNFAIVEKSADSLGVTNTLQLVDVSSALGVTQQKTAI